MNALARQVGRIVADRETSASVLDFAKLAKFVMANRNLSNAALAAERSSSEGNLGPRLAAIIRRGIDGISLENFLQEKVGIAAGGLTGSPLADYSAISSGFVASLANVGAFDAVAAAAVPLPLATGTAGAVTTAATAFSLSEGNCKPIGRLSITGQTFTPQKSHAVLAVSIELSRTMIRGGVELIGRQLRMAVATITDTSFIAAITAGAPTNTSVGNTADNVRADISTLLAQVTTGIGSRLFLIVPPSIAKRWAMLSTNGVAAFPGLGVMGGTIADITVIASDGCTAGQIVLVDASGIGASTGEVSLANMSEGSVVLDSAPNSPPTGSDALISLWQTNQVAVVVERWFTGVKLRPDAVAVTNAVSNSPA